MTTALVTDYWVNHGIFFLIFITVFPRLTLLISSVPFGGLFWWLGFFFAPRILVAFLATITYWSTNPVLVAMSWFVALSGESGEKYYFRKRVNYVRYRNVAPQNSENIIEPDFKRLN